VDRTRNEVERVLRNCLAEPHPLRRGRGGLAEIGRAGPLFDRLSDEEIETLVFPLLDELRRHVAGCFVCQAKALALAVVLCERRPRLGKQYRDMLADHLSRRAPEDKRDYRGEVAAVMVR
jgi:hypothetical protein